MRFIYAFRRSGFFPHRGVKLELPTGDLRKEYFETVKGLGFEGIEFGLDAFVGNDASTQGLRAVKSELEEIGLPCAAIRCGGSLADPTRSSDSENRIVRGIQMASALEAEIVNVALVSPPKDPNAAGASYGERVSQGASRNATHSDYEHTAKVMQSLAAEAKAAGPEIAIELHQRSIVDNSWSMIKLLEMIDHPNVGVNADAANTYWAYETPEESFEDAITALAPHTNYWHCKNLQRVHLPELQRAIYTRVPISDGDLDYRFAVSAMKTAKFDRSIGIEGLRVGDQLSADKRSLDGLKRLWQSLKDS